jgi:hypothetical protein
MFIVDASEDLYAILGVGPSDSHRAIRSAYLRLIREWHPDLNRSPDATARTQTINRAYDLLSDPAYRAKYDRQRALAAAGVQSGVPTEEPRHQATQPRAYSESTRPRTWDARLQIRLGRSWPVLFPLWILMGLADWVGEWGQVFFLGARFFVRRRPWPFAVYWTFWYANFLTLLTVFLVAVVLSYTSVKASLPAILAWWLPWDELTVAALPLAGGAWIVGRRLLGWSRRSSATAASGTTQVTTLGSNQSDGARTR